MMLAVAIAASIVALLAVLLGFAMGAYVNRPR